MDLPIGKRIQLARIARDVRQRDLAREIDLKQSLLSAVESGHRRPRDHEVIAILKALAMTPEDLERVTA